ncbi:uncharacterized protein EI90DRAFT_3039950, partial [Cantharellus anzutake]|uniref:uncharacterized protein n=1 Tax=Cantharellus anzutake TaxID=1750568 RepID=UPI001909018F
MFTVNCIHHLTHVHLQACPTIWRVYSYISSRRREKVLLARTDSSRLNSDSGEGFVGWDRMCFICGASGHWAFDCPSASKRPPEPHAFSDHIADMGAFGDGYPDEHTSRTAAHAINHLRQATQKLREEEYHRTFVPKAGKEARVRMRAKDRAQEKGLYEEDDWFSARAQARAA